MAGAQAEAEAAMAAMAATKVEAEAEIEALWQQLKVNRVAPLGAHKRALGMTCSLFRCK
jgi:hypothetical protein